MWVAGIPVAATPLWQLAQPVVTPRWVNTAPAQVSVVWQASHSRSVTMCLGPLPCACTPLWQVEQLPRVWVWSKLTAGFQAMGAGQIAVLADELEAGRQVVEIGARLCGKTLRNQREEEQRREGACTPAMALP